MGIQKQPPVRKPVWRCEVTWPRSHSSWRRRWGQRAGLGTLSPVLISKAPRPLACAPEIQVWPQMDLKVLWRSPGGGRRACLPPRPCGPQEAVRVTGLREGALCISAGSPAPTSWAGRHWIAGTAPSERGVPALWVCLRWERGWHRDRVCAAPWKEVLQGESSRAVPAPRPRGAPAASLTLGAAFGRKVTP